MERVISALSGAGQWLGGAASFSDGWKSWKSWLFYGSLGAAATYAGCKALSVARQKSFRDQVVLITGGANGMGKLMAKAFCREGAHVVLWDVDIPGLRKTLRALESEFGEGCAKAYEVDVSNYRMVRSGARMIEKKLQGTIDVLINNAGIMIPKPFLESTPEELSRTMSVNTLSHFWTLKTFLPTLKKKPNSHIVCMSSAAGVGGCAGLEAYAASKFAVFGLMESVRVELKRTAPNVDTLLVCPYYTNGKLFEGVKSPRVALLEEQYVVDRIIEAMKNREEILYLPQWPFTLVYFLRLFCGPRGVDRVSAFFRLEETMDEVFEKARATEVARAADAADGQWSRRRSRISQPGLVSRPPRAPVQPPSAEGEEGEEGAEGSSDESGPKAAQIVDEAPEGDASDS